MRFMQIIDCKTDRADEVNRLMDTWIERTSGRRTATHSIVGRDRSDSAHLVEIVEFPSYEEAMRNSKLPETDQAFREMVALCDEAPTFTDLDVVRDEQLHKATARRFFEEVMSGRDLDVVDELFAEDYRDHDPVNEVDTAGIAGVREEVSSYLDAFDLRMTVEAQLAEGDLVTTRWTVTGTQIAEFLGVAPDGRRITLTGQTTHRFAGGRIAEGWWNWDSLGMLQQLGIVRT